MITPRAIALPMEAAQRLLRQQGETAIAVRQTRPPRGEPSGPLRVIRQLTSGGGVELVVAASIPLPDREASHD
jgi:hypothetical protein